MREVADGGFFTRLNQAGADFHAGLPATLQHLGALGSDLLPAAPALPLTRALQAQLHTLAGAAVTFSLRELGQGARVLEQRLRVLTAFDSVGQDDWRAWLAALDEFVCEASASLPKQPGASSGL